MNQDRKRLTSSWGAARRHMAHHNRVVVCSKDGAAGRMIQETYRITNLRGFRLRTSISTTLAIVSKCSAQSTIWQTFSQGYGGPTTTDLLERTNLPGNNAKQMTKQARAARLQPPNTKRRSHRLTVRSQPLAVSLREMDGCSQYILAHQCHAQNGLTCEPAFFLFPPCRRW